MATDDERLLVRIEAQMRQFEKALQQATGSSNRAARQIERRFQTMERNLGKTGIALGRQLAGPLLALGSSREIIRAADSFTRIENALKIAGLEGEALTSTFESLYQIAQRNGAPVESLAVLYGRVAAAQKELNATSAEVLSLTESVSSALKVSGADANSASGALLQLSQALAGGVVRAEEYNGMIEGGLRPLLQAAANGLKEAGGSVAKLGQLMRDGKLSSEAFFRAIEAGSGGLQDLANTADSTVGQAFSRLRNTITRSIGKFDEAVRGSARMSDAIDGIGSAIEGLLVWLTKLDQNGAFDRFGAKVVDIYETVTREARQAGRSLGAQGLGESIGATDPIDNTIRDVFDTISATEDANKALGVSTDKLHEELQRRAALISGDLLAGTDPSAANTRIDQAFGAALPVKQVSIDDFKVPTTPKTGGTTKKTPAQTFQADIDAIRQRTAALQLEAEMVGRSAFEAEKALTTLNLENEAKRAGVALSPDVQASINAEADAYARATVQLAEMEQRQSELQEMQHFFADTAAQAFQDLVPAIETGNKALDNLLSTLIQATLQAALLGSGPLAALFGGGPVGGGVGGLLGPIFGGARAGGGPVSGGKAYVVGEKGPELLVPSVAGRVVPNGAMGGQQDVAVGIRVEPSPFFITTVDQRVTSGVRASERRMPGVMAERQARYG